MSDTNTNSANEDARVRLDRWLWAARFFKTRAQAKTAIDGGKVRLNGARPKPSKEVAAGMEVSVKRGQYNWHVAVLAVAQRRGSATEAAKLYREHEASIEAREAARAVLKMERAGLKIPAQAPDKHQRRDLAQLKRDANLFSDSTDHPS